jgi:hypothetical protein
MTDVFVSVGIPTGSIPKLILRPDGTNLRAEVGQHTVIISERERDWEAKIFRGETRLAVITGSYDGVIRSARKRLFDLESIEGELGQCPSCGGVTHPYRMASDTVVRLEKSKLSEVGEVKLHTELSGTRTLETGETIPFRGKVVEVRPDEVIMRLFSERDETEFRCLTQGCDMRKKKIAHAPREE